MIDRAGPDSRAAPHDAAPRRPVTCLLMSRDAHAALFDPSRAARLHRIAEVVHDGALAELQQLDPDVLSEVEVVVTGWGAPPLTAETLALAPRLRAALHAAGSVKFHVTEACWERGLLITTAAEANAVPVAEFTLAAVLFAGKRVLPSAARYRDTRELAVSGLGERSNHGRTVGLIGLSRIGRRVAMLLRPFDLRVLVADPYARVEDVEALGAEPVELDELLRRSDVVSVHAPDLPSTHHLLDARRLALLPDGATLINTARGALVDTAALERECASGRLTAMLDVTDPEPLPAGSPLWDLPNVLLTPHVAGSTDGEVARLADSALDELDRYRRGLPPLHPVTAADLATTA